MRLWAQQLIPYLPRQQLLGPTLVDYLMTIEATGAIIYPEHNDEYLKECIDNLKVKGIDTTEMEKLLCLTEFMN